MEGYCQERSGCEWEKEGEIKREREEGGEVYPPSLMHPTPSLSHSLEREREGEGGKEGKRLLRSAGWDVGKEAGKGGGVACLERAGGEEGMQRDSRTPHIRPSSHAGACSNNLRTVPACVGCTGDGCVADLAHDRDDVSVAESPIRECREVHGDHVRRCHGIESGDRTRDHVWCNEGEVESEPLRLPREVADSSDAEGCAASRRGRGGGGREQGAALPAAATAGREQGVTLPAAVMEGREQGVALPASVAAGQERGARRSGAAAITAADVAAVAAAAFLDVEGNYLVVSAFRYTSMAQVGAALCRVPLTR